MKLSIPMTPASLCDVDKTLVIPIYQRLFVWGEEQITNLLNDLCDACQKDQGKDYHLGVLTAHEDGQQRWEIVDGQQRLTFLTLLGCELIRASQNNNQNWADCWNKFVWRDTSKKQLRIFFNGRQDDRDDILKFLQSEDWRNAKFGKPAFECFAECFRKFSERLDCKMLQSFSSYCFHHFAFLVNELPREYRAEELNLYFEKMNSTGRQLSPLEVVKGKWFAPVAARWNRCMNFDEIFTVAEKSEDKIGEKGILNLQDILAENEAYLRIRKTEKIAGEDKPVKSRLVMRPDILALHALCCLYRKKGLAVPGIQRHKLLSTFQTAFSKTGGLSREDYLVELETYRQWIDENIVYLQETEGELDYAFRDNARVADNERNRMKQFQSMLHVSSGESQDWVLNAYFESNHDPLTYDALRKLERNWHANDSLDPKCLRYKAISRYWFWKLDYLLWEMHELDKDNELFSGLAPNEHDAIHEYRFRENHSIEHLYPQAQGDATSPWGCRDNPEAVMHCFGNLAMMSVEGNSAQQDDPIQVKFARVKVWLERGRLESIKMLLMFHLADKLADGWTVQKAQTHEKAMILLLQQDIKKFAP